MPRYDPPTYCAKIGTAAGGSAQIEGACIDMEQDAYNNLKPVWSGLDREVATYCDRIGRAAQGSYQILEACISMETEAQAEMPEFQF